MRREIHCADAIEWLKASPVLDGCSLIASMPDRSEFPKLSLAEWSEWFVDTAELILSRTPEDGVTLFFQSDIKVDGVWIDKAYLVQKAAERAGHALLWHKIFCRAEPGSVTYGRPAYSHLLCFSRGVRAEVSRSTADVVSDLGEKTWVRGMGLNACRVAARFVAEETQTRTLVNPFCGMGSVLAVANEIGLDAVGIERSPKRAEKAKLLKLTANGKDWDMDPHADESESEVLSEVTDATP